MHLRGSNAGRKDLWRFHPTSQREALVGLQSYISILVSYLLQSGVKCCKPFTLQDTDKVAGSVHNHLFFCLCTLTRQVNHRACPANARPSERHASTVAQHLHYFFQTFRKLHIPRFRVYKLTRLLNIVQWLHWYSNLGKKVRKLHIPRFRVYKLTRLLNIVQWLHWYSNLGKKVLLLLPHLVIPHLEKASSLRKKFVVGQSSANLRLAQKWVIAHFDNFVLQEVGEQWRHFVSSGQSSKNGLVGPV